MALYYELPVFRDVYKLILEIFEMTKTFPREYKYTLGPVEKPAPIHIYSMQLSLFDTPEASRIELTDLFEAYFSCRKNKRYTANALAFELHYELVP